MDQPLVGDPPQYDLGTDEVPWVLGPHLTDRAGPLARVPGGSRVLLIEARDFADRLPYHHQKLTLVFAAMRHFRDRLEDAGHDVRYHRAESFAAGLSAFFDDNPDATLVLMRPQGHGAAHRLRELVEAAGGSLRLVENELFCATRGAVDDRIDETLDTWGDADGFRWPVTRAGARSFLDHFIQERLPGFGPYQDAMRPEDWAMAHALLSPALNLGLLHPWAVVRAVEEVYETDPAVSIQSAEGCIRQLLGWREFVRHAYRHAMPALATANRLGASHDLPSFYWTGETDMDCLRETVDDVRSRGYAHHIQRLMVIANFATLWGVEPSQLNEWFHATFVDAYHWVTTPNVVEMDQ